MTDIVDTETRSRMMAGIKGKNTKPELALRQALHARGFRYRLHTRSIIGRPDLVFPKREAVVFVNGCFWHRHEGCRYTTTPTTRTEFWQTKFKATVARDTFVRSQLFDAGWRVATIWECALRNPQNINAVASLLAAWLDDGAAKIEIGDEATLLEASV